MNNPCLSLYYLFSIIAIASLSAAAPAAPVILQESPSAEMAPRTTPVGFVPRSVCVNKSLLIYKNDAFTMEFGTKFRPETFYGKNTNYLSGSSLDQVLYWQTTFDMKLAAQHGQEMKFLATMRNKTRWGNPQMIRVTTSQVKVESALTPPHTHFISRMICWMRELWLEISLNKALSIDTRREHIFKIGAFPFDVGRGIALGDAYATAPGNLGFFADNIIDQFAPGMLLHGDITCDNSVTYDVYFAVLQNFAFSFDSNTQEIYANRLDREDFPFRGFGHIDWVGVLRSKWTIFNDPSSRGKLVVEPYLVYNSAPEQRVDYTADSTSHLVTLGLAMDYANPRWEFGWETALNLGQQKVFAWDRNNVILGRDGTTGAIIEQYSHVFVGPKNATGSNKAPFTNANRAVVNSSPRTCALDGKELGSSGLYNDPDRFRNCYINKYRGKMFVIDGAYHTLPGCLKVASTFGYASGDESPNADLRELREAQQNGVFEGFIGLQEVYSGRLVRSVFIIGSQQVPRPLTTPRLTIDPSSPRFAQTVNGFTNLVYTGMSAKYTPKNSRRRFEMMPNALVYWQAVGTNKFSAVLQREINEPASKFLGTEINLFAEFSLLDNLRFFAVSAVFIPGDHYRDIKGLPLNSNQQRALSRLNTTGRDIGEFPTLGDSTAFTINAGMEYRF